MNRFRRLLALFRRDRLDLEMDAEMRAHLERETQQNIARGMAPDEARCAARRAFGGLDQLKERERDARGLRWIENALRDFRYAARSLRKSPGFTAVAVVSLALGIGANTAVFSLVNGILLSSLPVPNPQELRVLTWSGVEPRIGTVTGSFQIIGGGGGRSSGAMRFTTESGQRAQVDAFTYPIYRQLREQGTAFAEIMGYVELRDVNVRAQRETGVAVGLMVSDNFFAGLGVRPLIGRLLEPGDDASPAATIAVISDEFWVQHYDRDPEVLGRIVTLNGRAFTVVGVLPREFRGIDVAGQATFYVPMSAQPLLMGNWLTTSTDRWWVQLVARVRPTVRDSQLQAALDTMFAQQTTALMAEPRVEIRPGRAGPAVEQARYRNPLLFLFGVVGVVILVACANLAGLSLVRGAARQHEYAVRAALGSGRWRLIRQSLAESGLLATGGGGLGLLLALWGKPVLARLLAGSPEGLRYDLSLDWAVLAFTFALAMATVLLAGLLPAWRSGRIDPLAGLKSRGALGAPRLRVGRILVVTQIALSVLLVAGAGLFGRTLFNLVRIHPGFATDNLLLFKLNPSAAGVPRVTVVDFFDRTQEALQRIPGVRAVTLMQHKLLSGSMSGGGFFILPAHPELTGQQAPRAHRLNVSESFLTTMALPLVLGRDFTAADTEGSPKVVLVNQTFVRRYFPYEIPIGQVLKTGNDEWRIVGVCGDSKYTSIKTEAPPTVYVTYRQTGVGHAYFAVRTSLPPLSVVSAVRAAVHAIDPHVPLADITTQEAVRDSKIAQERLFATLVGSLAGLSLLLSMIGVYGLMAYSVTRRTREIGVRMALGAAAQDIGRSILREALLLAGAGLLVGVPMALALARLVRSQLYGVTPNDPVALIGGAIVIAAPTILAAWVPARRAARVDPLIALRAE